MSRGVNSFQYTAWTIEGLKSGLVDREDAVAVSRWLESQGWVPVEVRACRVMKPAESTRHGGKRVGLVDLAMLSRQLELLLNAGVPLARALGVAADQSRNHRLSSALRDVRTSIAEGSLLSEALETRPNIFPGIFTNFVRAGELDGRLPGRLSRLSRLLESEVETKQKLKSALALPGSIAVLIGLALLTVIVENYGLAVPGILIGAALGLAIFLRTNRGRDVRDNLLLRIPMIGPIHHRMAQSRFARILSALLSSGVPLLAALQVSARASGNRKFAGAVLDSRQSLREGLGLAESLESSRVFTPLFLRMTAAGEETGDLEALLDRAADYDDSEVGYATGRLTAVAGPILLVLLGGLVLIVALAILGPAGSAGAFRS